MSDRSSKEEHTLLPAPWEFRREGYQQGPGIFTKDGHCLAALYWPGHAVELTEQCEREVYAAGEVMAKAPALVLEVASLRAALTKLRNEVGGILGTAKAHLQSGIGYTNVEVLELRYKEANEALQGEPGGSK